MNVAAPRPRAFAAIAAAAAAAAAALAAVNVVFGPLNQDEGWLLLAAKNWRAGLLPYRDAFFTQGPAFPAFYGIFSPLWAPFGVLGGRVFTALLSLAALACVWLAVRALADDGSSRAGPALGARSLAVCVSLLALSPDWSYFTAIPKTYALGALGLSFGVLCLACRRPHPFFSGVFFAVAAGARLSLGAAAVPIWIFLILDSRSGEPRCGKFSYVHFASGCAVALALIFLPAIVGAGEGFFFAQRYHTARAAAPFAQWLVLRAGFFSLLAQGYAPLVAGGAFAAGCGLRGAAATGGRGLTAAVFAAFAAVTLLHALVPFPYNDYNTPAMPLAAIAAAVVLTRVLNTPGRLAAALVAACVFAAASPRCMQWVGGEQHLFWFETDSKPALFKLREVGRFIRERTEPGEPVFTQDAYIAVEADRPVPQGLEMGPFSVFPGLSREEAEKFRVHNVETLKTEITYGPAKIAAVTEYDFAVSCPSTDPLGDDKRADLFGAVSRRYPRVLMSDGSFGQNRTRLLVLGE